MIKSPKKFLQNLFRQHFDNYQKRHKQPLKNIKAAEAIIHCRTAENGTTRYHCPKDKEHTDIPHACKHRSCPLCAAKSIKQWIDQQKQRLLPCEHYHLVFTLPQEYLGLWQYNRAWFIKTQFDVCREVLIQMLADEKHLGAKPGIIMALHTWGRKLNLHPHIHALVTAGGLTQTQQWKPVENDFLLPVRAVKVYYRGKFQDRIKCALKEKTLILPPDETETSIQRQIKQLYKKQWSVRIQEKYSHGKGVLLYLSRYLKGGPLKPGQIQAIDNQEIRFSYKDHRKKCQSSLSLSIDEFMRRILMHVPEPRIHTLRHYGLYASQASASREASQKQLVGAPDYSARTQEKPQKDTTFQVLCKHCGSIMIAGISSYRKKPNENSYTKDKPGLIEGITTLLVDKIVQQNVEASPHDHRTPNFGTS